MPADSPSDRADISTVLVLLDEALVHLTKVEDSHVNLEEAAKELEVALHASYAALAAGGDYREFRKQTMKAVEAGRTTLQLLQDVPSEDMAVFDALRLVAQAFGSLQRVGYKLDGIAFLPSFGPPSTIARATFDEPKLIEARSQIVRPHVPLPHRDDVELELEEAPQVEAPPPITSLEELRAAMERTAVELKLFNEPKEEDAEAATPEPPPEVPVDEAILQRFGVVVPIEEQIADQAGECLLDLANMGRMRRPTMGESWSSGEETERRLVRRIDALAACGEDNFPALVDMLSDRPVPDPELTWALIFLFGCFDRDDTFDQCWRIARAVDFDDAEFGREFVPAVSDAFTFAPHPKIDGALGEWLVGDHPRRREVALRALSRRRTLLPQQLENALYDADRDVRLAATQAVGVTENAQVTYLNRALHHEDEDFVRSALWGFTKRVKVMGIRRAMELVEDGRPEYADAALLVAIAGGEPGRKVLFDAMVVNDSPTLIRALGWLGDPRVMDELLIWLERGDDTRKGAALMALERITGASISEAEPEGAKREVPPYEREVDLLDEPDLWRAWWHAHRGEVRRETRYRFGHVFMLHDSIWELESEDFSNEERELSFVELVAWSGGALPLDLNGFIARQRRQLEQWKGYLGQAMNLFHGGWHTLAKDRVTLY